jgi:N-acyl homoserine lactone hydrolase
MALLVLVGCGEGGAPDDPADLTPAPSADTAADVSLKLYVFDCGHLRFDTVAAFGIDDDETDVRELIVPCYVVEHPEGRMLWDGGLPSSVAETDGWHDNARLDRPLAQQLAELNLGFDLGSLDYVAFSHMHYDHVGVANEVEGATWLVQQPEYDAMFAESVTVAAARPELYENLRDAARVVLNGDHDVFGDGRVRILSSPGHTPGHQVLFLDLADTGPLVLSGDLYHFRLSRAERRVPVFNFDAETTLASMERIEAFTAETGATFWIEHDLALFQELDTAPSYYE